MTDICSICLNNIKDNDETLKLECGHTFHKKCAIHWFRSPHSSGNCPLCQHNPHGKKNNKQFFYYMNNEMLDNRFKLVEKKFYKNEKNIEKNLEKNNLIYQKYLDKNTELDSMKKEEKKFVQEYIKYVQKRKDIRIKLFRLECSIKSIKSKIVSNYPIVFS